MSGKTALITGASSGIGRAAACKLASLGYNLIITGRRTDRLQKLVDELEDKYKVKVHALGFDIRDRTQCEAALGALPEHFRQIDVLINNAGLAAGLEPIDEGDTLDWDQMIDTNVKGLLYITRIVSQMMIAAERGGHIINLGSIAGVQTYANGAVYCASKHAVHALSEGMRIDFLKYGIKVTEIQPGMVETEFSLVRFHGDRKRADNVYKGVKPLSGEDIADIIGWVISLPPHININDLVVMPTQQANAFYTHRK